MNDMRKQFKAKPDNVKGQIQDLMRRAGVSPLKLEAWAAGQDTLDEEQVELMGDALAGELGYIGGREGVQLIRRKRPAAAVCLGVRPVVVRGNPTKFEQGQGNVGLAESRPARRPPDLDTVLLRKRQQEEREAIEAEKAKRAQSEAKPLFGLGWR